MPCDVVWCQWCHVMHDVVVMYIMWMWCFCHTMYKNRGHYVTTGEEKLSNIAPHVEYTLYIQWCWHAVYLSPIRFPRWLRSSPDWPLSHASGSWNWSSLTACASTSDLPLTSTENQLTLSSSLPHLQLLCLWIVQKTKNWRWGRPGSKSQSSY